MPSPVISRVTREMCERPSRGVGHSRGRRILPIHGRSAIVRDARIVLDALAVGGGPGP